MNMHRRAALQTLGSIALTFALADAFAAEGPGALPGDLARNKQLDAWIRLSADGKVTLQTGKVEIGQGILTAFAQICADELDVDLTRMLILSGDTALCPNEGVTAGSMSMPEGGAAVRAVSAEMRAVLVAMAAAQLNVPAAELKVRDGIIAHGPTNKQITYWALVGGKALQREAMGGVAPKPASEHLYIGHSVPRRDLPAKIKGDPIFVQDMRPDNLAHGRVVRTPSYGAKLLSVDIVAVEKLPGVLKVYRDGDFLGVVADREWRAIKAANALAASARWEEAAQLPADPHAWLLAQKTQDIAVKRQARNGAPPARTFEASFKRYYQMHGSIGPACAVAEFNGDRLTVITHSQSVFDTGPAIAKMLNMDPAKVRMRHMNGSGCYGHNSADDVAADAALLARALPGRAVRVQWMRGDEHGCEPYGPAMVTKLRAGVDAQGNVLDWSYELWSTSHGTRPGGEPGNLLAARTLAKPFAQPVPVNGGPPNYAADRNGIALYAFPGQDVTTHFVTDMPVRVSAMRGLGAYANVFSIESFMDELALAAKADPVAFRLRQLTDERAKAVINQAAMSFGWSSYKKTPGRGRGIGFARYKNIAAYCAVCMEVAVDPTTRAIKVLRASMAADAGEIVNPDGLKHQLEGGLIQSLSWTLKERVQYDDKHILSRDWATYPILTFTEVPAIDIELLDHPGQPFLGAGEASQGPSGAALANAVFDACGARVREMPLTAQAIRAALA